MGSEMHFGEAQLVYACDRRTPFYICQFNLPVKVNFDPLTSLYMDGIMGGSDSPFQALQSLIFSIVGTSASSKSQTMAFRLTNTGLWRAEPAVQFLPSR